MRVYTGTVNAVYPDLVADILRSGRSVGPRGTATLELSPVTLVLERPEQRLVTSYGRPINLAFALAEVLWILRGRQDVEMLAFYNDSIRQFSDNGTSFNAAYGHRLRWRHGFDQLRDVELTLREDPDSRRGTLCLWHPDDAGFRYRVDNPDDPPETLPRVTLDRACNVLAHPMIRDDQLNWLQVVRSNDVILGVPYNFVQWTCLQEYLASRLGLQPGELTYVADSMHMYVDGVYYPKNEGERIAPFDIYEHYPFAGPGIGSSDQELEEAQQLEGLCRTGNARPDSQDGTFWAMVAWLTVAHRQYRAHQDIAALETLLNHVPATWALTQARFYMAKRWHKTQDFAITDLLASYCSNDTVMEWLIDDRPTIHSGRGHSHSVEGGDAP